MKRNAKRSMNGLATLRALSTSRLIVCEFQKYFLINLAMNVNKMVDVWSWHHRTLPGLWVCWWKFSIMTSSEDINGLLLRLGRMWVQAICARFGTDVAIRIFMAPWVEAIRTMGNALITCTHTRWLSLSASITGLLPLSNAACRNDSLIDLHRNKDSRCVIEKPRTGVMLNLVTSICRTMPYLFFSWINRRVKRHRNIQAISFFRTKTASRLKVGQLFVFISLHENKLFALHFNALRRGERERSAVANFRYILCHVYLDVPRARDLKRWVTVSEKKTFLRIRNMMPMRQKSAFVIKKRVAVSCVDYKLETLLIVIEITTESQWIAMTSVVSRKMYL